MKKRNDICYNHLFSYRSVKIHIDDSIIMDASKFTTLQKNKRSCIKLNNNDKKYNFINSNMYNMFFGLYGMQFVEFTIPVFYCSKEKKKKIVECAHEQDKTKDIFLEKHYYFDEKKTKTYEYFIKRKKESKVCSRQEVEGIKLDYVQFVLYVNSSGQIFCMPLNLNIKKNKGRAH